MLKSATTIGPADRNRRMSLAEFDHAEAQEGYLYELSRGVIIASDVPDPRHLAQVDKITQQLADYRKRHHGVIHRVAGGSDCKILLRDLESERHPDIAVYKTPPPRNGDLWASWKPEDLQPYVDHVLEVFGPERVMFGSDWPVCLLAGSYERVVAACEATLSRRQGSEREMIFGDNAAKVYRLKKPSI